MVKELDTFFGDNRREIGIITGKQTECIAVMLKRALIERGYRCRVFSKPPAFRTNQLFIVFTPQIFKNLPKYYCVYQVEQLTYDYVKTEHYYSLLENAIAIFDYSRVNYDILKEDDSIGRKLFYLPFDIDRNELEESVYENNKKYDVLFYGATSSERRKKYFEVIREQYDIKIINDLLEKRLKSELRKARIIVNIHYKDNAILESCRLCEVLSLGNSIVISETSIDKDLDEMFSPFVEFVPAADPRTMLVRIETVLKNEDRIPEIIQERKRAALNKESCFLSYISMYF